MKETEKILEYSRVFRVIDKLLLVAYTKDKQIAFEESMGIEIDVLRRCCLERRIRWTEHTALRMLKRNISKKQVAVAIQTGEILEQYPDDYPFASCLVLGYDENGTALHVVCGLSPEEVWIITAYYPDSEKWEPDWKTRRRKE